MPSLFPITIDDEIAEVRREIQLRERVYPNWVHTGRLKQERADRQLEAMRAVMARLETIRDAGE